MAIHSNLKSLAPRREAFKREITLISSGAGNRQAWPGGKITVYPWDSTVDDLVLNTTRQGGAHNLFFQMLEKVCDLKGALDDFYAGETNLVLLTSRALANEGTVIYTTVCPRPGCGHRSQESIRVPDELEPVGLKDENWPGFDDIVLPVCGDHVRIRPLQIRDEKILIDRSADQKKLISDGTLRIMLHVEAISADGKDWGKPSTLDELLTWYNALPPKDARFLEKQETDLSPHANALIPHKCDVCGMQFTQPLMFDTDFFR